jgi:hypothetical protein
MPAVWRLRIPKAVQVALRKRTYNHQRREPNGGLNSGGGGGRMNWICMWIGSGTSFTSVASGGPILFTCPVNNAAPIPRTFASLQRPALRSQGREIPRTIACSESIRSGMQRPGFRQTAAYRSYARCIRMLGQGCDRRAEAGGEFCRSRFGFSFGRKPKERARTKGTEPRRGGEVLPNVLPLPRKSSLKQDEPRPNKMDYVIEIQGTA